MDNSFYKKIKVRLSINLLFLLFYLALKPITAIACTNCNSQTFLQKQLSEKSDTNKIDKTSKRILKRYQKKGYITASFDSINNSSTNFYKGPRFFYDTISYNFDITQYHPKLIQHEPINLKTLKNFEVNVINALKSQGYYFAQLHKKVSIDSANISISYNLNKGDLIYVDSCAYNNKIVSYNYLTRTTGLISNKPINHRMLINLEKNINLTNIIKFDSLQITTINNKLKPKIFLSKASQNTFNGIIGIATKDKIEATGSIELSLINTLKHGESIYLKWNKNNTLSQTINLNTNIPYLFKSPLGITGNFHLYKVDSTYTKTHILGGLVVTNIDYGKFAINTNYYSSIVNFSNDSLNYANSNSILYGLGYTYSSLNHFLNPNAGFKINTNFSAGNKNTDFNPSSQHKSTLFIADLQLYKPIELGLGVLFLSSHSGVIINDSLAINDLNIIGGINNFRGFNENSIYSKSHLLISADYRINLSRDSFAYAFSSIGLTEEFENKKFKMNTRKAFGFGLNLKTKAGIIQVAYALGFLNNQTTKFNDAKIHIGYLNTF